MCPYMLPEHLGTFFISSLSALNLMKPIKARFYLLEIKFDCLFYLLVTMETLLVNFIINTRNGKEIILCYTQLLKKIVIKIPSI